LFVYFAQPKGGGLIKIGSTRWLKSRVAALQGASPVEIVLLAAAQGSRKHEVRLHDHFAEHRARGEWFNPCPELVRLVESLPRWHPEIDENKLPRFVFDKRNLFNALYLAGYGQTEIAAHFGFSRQRADQLITVKRKGDQHWRRRPAPRKPIAEFIAELDDGSTTDPLAIEHVA
jgi:hypothetical protein